MRRVLLLGWSCWLPLVPCSDVKAQAASQRGDLVQAFCGFRAGAWVIHCRVAPPERPER